MYTITMSGRLHRALSLLGTFSDGDAPKDVVAAFHGAVRRQAGMGTQCVITAPRRVVRAILDELNKLVDEIERKNTSAQALGIVLKDLRMAAGQAMVRPM